MIFFYIFFLLFSVLSVNTSNSIPLDDLLNNATSNPLNNDGNFNGRIDLESTIVQKNGIPSFSVDNKIRINGNSIEIAKASDSYSHISSNVLLFKSGSSNYLAVILSNLAEVLDENKRTRVLFCKDTVDKRAFKVQVYKFDLDKNSIQFKVESIRECDPEGYVLSSASKKANAFTVEIEKEGAAFTFPMIAQKSVEKIVAKTIDPEYKEQFITRLERQKSPVVHPPENSIESQESDSDSDQYYDCKDTEEEESGKDDSKNIDKDSDPSLSKEVEKESVKNDLNYQEIKPENGENNDLENPDNSSSSNNTINSNQTIEKEPVENYPHLTKIQRFLRNYWKPILGFGITTGLLYLFRSRIVSSLFVF